MNRALAVSSAQQVKIEAGRPAILVRWFIKSLHKASERRHTEHRPKRCTQINYRASEAGPSGTTWALALQLLMETVQQNDERALPLVDVMHANAVDFGETVVVGSGSTASICRTALRGWAIYICSARTHCSPLVFDSYLPLKLALTGCAPISFLGLNFLKLGHMTAQAYFDAWCQPD